MHREKGRWEQWKACLASHGFMTAIALGLEERQQVVTRIHFHPCNDFSENSDHCCGLQGDAWNPNGRKANGSPSLWTPAMEITDLVWMAPSSYSHPTWFGHGQPVLFEVKKEPTVSLCRELEPSLAHLVNGSLLSYSHSTIQE